MARPFVSTFVDRPAAMKDLAARFSFVTATRERSAPSAARAPALIRASHLELIGALIERLPVVGTMWTDAYAIGIGIADALNMTLLRDRPARQVVREFHVVFLY